MRRVDTRPANGGLMKVKVKNLDYELREKKAKARLAIMAAKLEAIKSEFQWPREPEEEIKIGK